MSEQPVESAAEPTPVPSAVPREVKATPRAKKASRLKAKVKKAPVAKPALRKSAKVRRVPRGNVALSRELDVMAAASSLLETLDADQQVRALVWLGDRFKVAHGAGSTVLLPRKGSKPAKGSTKKVGANKTSAGRDVRKKETEGPTKAELAEVARVLAAKKPRTASETFLVLLGHLENAHKEGVATRAITILGRAAKVKMKNPSDAGDGAAEKGLAKRTKGLWRLTAAGTKYFKSMPTK
jgi:hypothetical protein